jgi:hypothetical protein
MKNKTIIILIIVIAGLLAALYLMGYLPFGNEPEESNNEDFSIKSNDESAELFIPKGALPSGVDLNDISISKVSNSQTEKETEIVYDLKPDGLVFKEEVLFNVTLENAHDALPLVFISNDAGIELVNNTFTKFDLENQTQLVSVPLTHFSNVFILYVTKTVEIKLDAPNSLEAEHDRLRDYLGETVETTASFTLMKRKIVRDYTPEAHFLVFELLEPSIRYSGMWDSSDENGSKFAPVGEFGGKPSTTKVALGQTNTVQDNTFKSDKLGLGRLSYKAEVTFSFKLTRYKSKSDYEEGKAKYSRTYRNQKHWVRSDLWIIIYKPILKIQGIFVTKYQNKPDIDVVVEIHGPRRKTGVVTLTGPGIEPMKQPVHLGVSGSTFNTFIHPFSGEITVLVEVDKYNATRKHIID